MKKQKRTPLSITVSIILSVAITVTAYLFFQSQAFRDFYWSFQKGFAEDVLPEESWEKEGLVLASDKYMLLNPDVVKTEKGYKMYFHDSENIYVATSPDGLEWKIVEKPVLTRAGGPAAVQLPDKKFRMYFYDLSTGGAIKSAVSEDGIDFKVEEGTRIPAGEGALPPAKSLGHPSVLSVGDGYIMYFDDGIQTRELKASIVNNNCEILYEQNRAGIGEIHYALSKDGLNWTYGNKIIGFGHANLPNLMGGGSPGIEKTGNEYRMYFSPNRNSVITTHGRDTIDCRIENMYDPFWVATSADGVNFQVVKQTNVFGEDPEVVEADGRLRLYVWDHNRIYSYVQITAKK